MSIHYAPFKHDAGLRAVYGAALAALILISTAGCSRHQTTTATAPSDGSGESTPTGDAAAPIATDESSPADDPSAAVAAETPSPAETASAAAATDVTERPAPGDPDAAQVADPAHIVVYVTPYYNSEGPTIAVGRFSSGLASSNENDFLSTITTMKEQWQQLSFPELYVGAIRLYDLGYRNEAVYWFYTAQYRGRQFDALLDTSKIGRMGDPAFELRAAADSFFELVGPWINKYAFGDTDHLIEVIRKVQSEGRQITDLNAIYPNVAFIEKSGWPSANTEVADGMDGLLTEIVQQKASMQQERVKNGTEARISKLTNKELPSP
jgi:hypothetical protein